MSKYDWVVILFHYLNYFIAVNCSDVLTLSEDKYKLFVLIIVSIKGFSNTKRIQILSSIDQRLRKVNYYHGINNRSQAEVAKMSQSQATSFNVTVITAQGNIKFLGRFLITRYSRRCLEREGKLDWNKITALQITNDRATERSIYPIREKWKQ